MVDKFQQQIENIKDEFKQLDNNLKQKMIDEFKQTNDEFRQMNNELKQQIQDMQILLNNFIKNSNINNNNL